MIVIGLTGSIGMGKSTASRMIRILGVPIHDSDRAVHEALQSGGSAFNEVSALFPQALEGGAINRQKLGQIVFGDPQKRQALEAILHPAAQKSQMDFIQSHQGKEIVCLEIPLLFETGAEKRLDYVVCVTATLAVQRKRVLKRHGMTEEKFSSILAAQMPSEEKAKRADFVVQTGCGYVVTFLQVYKTLKAIKEEKRAGNRS